MIKLHYYIKWQGNIVIIFVTYPKEIWLLGGWVWMIRSKDKWFRRPSMCSCRNLSFFPSFDQTKEKPVLRLLPRFTAGCAVVMPTAHHDNRLPVRKSPRPPCRLCRIRPGRNSHSLIVKWHPVSYMHAAKYKVLGASEITQILQARNRKVTQFLRGTLTPLNAERYWKHSGWGAG